MNDPKKPIPIHLAIDLECLDLRPSALVLSAGLVAFTVPGGVVGTFYTEPHKGEQGAKGRTIRPETMEWWGEQSNEAQRVLLSDGIPVHESLAGITHFFNRWNTGFYRVEGVWGWGSDFDNAMLQDLFVDFDWKVPWSYKLNRCGRTVAALAGGAPPPPQGTKHHALDDAMYQAEYIRRSILRLKGEPNVSVQ